MPSLTASPAFALPSPTHRSIPLSTRFTLYRALRKITGPVLAYRLSLAWRAAS